MRIIFAGTPDFATPALKQLLEKYELIAVYTQPDRHSGRGKKLRPSPVKLLAEQYDIPLHQPENLHQQSNIIAQLKPDIMVVVAYGVILPQAILDIPKLGCLNTHASLLPKWRGAAPIQRAIENGDRTTGISIMQMDAGLDTGAVYQTFETPIKPTDTSASLHDTLAHMGAHGVCQVIDKLARIPNYLPKAQNAEHASYAKKINKSEGLIQWEQDAHSIQQKIRAFNPWPICQTNHAQQIIRVWQSAVLPHNHPNAKPGEIIEINAEGVYVQTGNGIVCIQTLQKPGSKALAAALFCQGYTLNIGDILF